MKYKSQWLVLIIYVITVIPIALLGQITPQRVNVPNSNNEVLIIYKADSHKIGFTSTRPNKNNSHIIFSVAAAFTAKDLKSINGRYMIDGKAFNNKVNQGKSYGFCAINKKKLVIKSTSDSLNFYWNRTKKEKGDFFEQCLLVVNGKDANCNLFQKLVFMRAIAIRNGVVCVVETSRKTNFKEFSSMMISIGITDALYLDMDSWDEGWYRHPNGKIITIGHDKVATKHQTNWLYFEK